MLTASSASDHRTYVVAGMSCSHCERALTHELGQVPGVKTVVVDLDAKLLTVGGADLDDAALRAAIDEAGYDGVPA